MNTILQGIVGSQAYGLATPESDVDRLGVFICPLHEILSLDSHKETVTHKGEEGDIALHEVGKFLSLAMSCNPTILELLFLPTHEIVTKEGELVLSLRQAVLSKRVLQSYPGYVFSQAGRLERRGDFDPDLRKRTEKHGRHCWRLLLQGEQLMRTGTMTVQLTPDEAEECRQAGRNAVDQQEKFVAEVRERCDTLKKTMVCVLPDDADRRQVNRVLLQIRGVMDE